MFFVISQCFMPIGCFAGNDVLTRVLQCFLWVRLFGISFFFDNFFVFRLFIFAWILYRFFDAFLTVLGSILGAILHEKVTKMASKIDPKNDIEKRWSQGGPALSNRSRAGVQKGSPP